MFWGVCYVMMDNQNSSQARRSDETLNNENCSNQLQKSKKHENQKKYSKMLHLNLIIPEITLNEPNVSVAKITSQEIKKKYIGCLLEITLKNIKM